MHVRVTEFRIMTVDINPLMGTLKPHSNGPLYSNRAYGDWYIGRWWVWAWGPAQSPPRCTKCNSPPTNGQSTNF